MAVKVYVRPRPEQPELLRSNYAEAIRNLESRGVQVFCRSGMHEKIAAVDGRILWHGILGSLDRRILPEVSRRPQSPSQEYDLTRSNLRIGGHMHSGAGSGRPVRLRSQTKDELTLSRERDDGRS